jgi:hypothetical protein
MYKASFYVDTVEAESVSKAWKEFTTYARYKPYLDYVVIRHPSGENIFDIHQLA